MSGLKTRLVLGADAGVDAVAGDDQVGVGVVGVGIDFGLEHQLHTQLLAACLQDVQQLLAPDADKPVAAGADDLALEVQLDVVPVVEGQLDLGRGDGSHWRMLSMVASENTTPQPKVS
jgi:hypothetical protein